MRSSLQLRTYSSFNQVENDLNLLDNGISKVHRLLSSIKDLSSPKNIARFRSCVSVHTSLVSAIRNIQIWNETASAEPIPRVIKRIGSSSKKIEEMESMLYSVSSRAAKPSKELLQAAAKIKIYSDSLLIDNFDKSGSKSLVIFEVASGKPVTIVRFSYSNLIDSSSFRFPEFFINVTEREGVMSLCMSCFRSLNMTGEYHRFNSTKDSVDLVNKKLKAFGLGSIGEAQ